MRQELTDKIMMCLMSKGIKDASISQDIIIILGEYEVTPRETQLAIRDDDKNRYYMQKFLISKTVKGCAKRTINYYQTEVWKILNKIGKPADEVTTDDIRLYLAIRQNKDKVSGVTANNELRVLGSFFDFLRVEELIVKDPTAKIEKIKTGKQKKKTFSELDVEKLRCACKNAWETAVVEVLLSTGCRVSELVNIRIDDINNDELIVHGKGNKDRTVYLNAKAVMAIINYLKERGDSNPYLFPGGFFGSPRKDCMNWYRYPDRVDKERHTDMGTVECKVRRIGEKAGVENVHPHRFRRTCATLALRRGMPIEQVSKMLGHESISTTQIYLDLSEEDLKQAHKKFVI